MAVPTKKPTDKKVRKFRVAVHEDFCKGCELCVVYCPKNCFAMTTDRLNAKGIPFAECVRPEECIGCQACATICPDAVIELFEITDDESEDSDG